MKKKNISVRDVEECQDKIDAILAEYRCYIGYDSELGSVVLVDRDNNDYVEL